MTESTSGGGTPKPAVESGRSGRLGHLNNLLDRLDPFSVDKTLGRENQDTERRKVSLTVRTDETDPDKTLGQVILRYPSDEKGNSDPQTGLEMELSFTRLKNQGWDSLNAKLPLSKRDFNEKETILLWEKWQKQLKGLMDRKIKNARDHS